MASILYAWEFGANLGHVGPFMPLARELRQAGHEVHWAVTQPSAVGDFLAKNGFTWLAAPTMPEASRPGPPLSYADILLRFGYADPRSLFGLVGAWREADAPDGSPAGAGRSRADGAPGRADAGYPGHAVLQRLHRPAQRSPLPKHAAVDAGARTNASPA